jgi:hypothetical protein
VLEISLARQDIGDVQGPLGVTGTPLPQSPPTNPTTPLDAAKLASILHGEAEVGEQGVVTVTVPRTQCVMSDGVAVQPETGLSTTIEFEPLGGSTAAVVSDFSMTAAEVTPVVMRMLTDQGWFQGCLYNQETAAQPQLTFDHLLKSGDAYDLAQEIRRGLDLTQSQ